MTIDQTMASNPESPGVKTAGVVLDYDTPAPGTLTLQEFHRCLRVIFPVQPKWAYIVTIVSQLLVGTIKLASGIYIVLLIHDLFRGLRGHGMSSEQIALERHFYAQTMFFMTTVALFWWGSAAYHFRMYRRFGRVPCTLTASKDELILTRVGWWNIRERKWPASEITSIEFKAIKGNLNRRRALASLRIKRAKGRRLYFRLSSTDPLLPGRIAEKLASTLGCPLKIK